MCLKIFKANQRTMPVPGTQSGIFPTGHFTGSHPNPVSNPTNQLDRRPRPFWQGMAGSPGSSPNHFGLFMTYYYYLLYDDDDGDSYGKLPGMSVWVCLVWLEATPHHTTPHTSKVISASASCMTLSTRMLGLHSDRFDWMSANFMFQQGCVLHAGDK